MVKLTRLVKQYLELKIKELSQPAPDKSGQLLLNTIKGIYDGSNKISAWSLSVVGGSLLAILSSEYVKPAEQKVRLIYFLFVVGWTFIGISIFYGKKVAGGSIVADMQRDKPAALLSTFTNCNNWYGKQLKFFNLGLLCFGLWLLLYLVWWVFGISLSPINQQKT